MRTSSLFIRVALASLWSMQTLAQGLGQQRAGAQLEEVHVYGASVTSSLTAKSAAQARAELERIPGAIGFVDHRDYTGKFTLSLGDALEFTPGVYADTSALRESRISVRGSGLNSSFERRGIAIYRDGVPLTRASGTSEFQEVDPVSLDYIEVYKGANGLRYGGASLGGVVNMVSPSALSTGDRTSLRLEGGSFDTQRGSLAVARRSDSTDVYLAHTRLKTSGYRDHSAVESHYSFANIGVQLHEQIENRSYLTLLHDCFELAGSLSLDEALSTPREAGKPVTIGPFFPGGPITVLDPGPEADDWDRNLKVLRIVNKTGVDLNGILLNAGAWYSRRQLDHAITRFAGIIDQDEKELGLFLRGSGNITLLGLDSEWTAGLEANDANNDARRLENVDGRPGALRSASKQESRNALIYAQIDTALNQQWRLITGLQGVRTERESTARLNDVDGKVVRRQVNPRIGLLWNVVPEAQIFANLSRGFEPATMADLTSGGALPFTPLEAQKAWTLELGSRGRLGAVAWDVAAYRSELQGELLDFGVPGNFGFVSFTDNAGDTVHQGLELGVDISIPSEALTARGLDLTWRQVLNVNDFHFVSDANYGSNTLAGVPTTVYVTELTLRSARGWYTSLSARHMPTGPWVDFANTTRSPGYTLAGLSAGIDVSDRWGLFVSAENIFDRKHIANTGTNANQQLEDARFFTPGQGRAIFAGVTLEL